MGFSPTRKREEPINGTDYHSLDEPPAEGSNGRCCRSGALILLYLLYVLS
jgi:hypothetical protein